MTAQITVRAPEELVERVKAASASAGRSTNDYVTAVLDAECRHGNLSRIAGR